jgi:superfamily II DNA or RNA helicase
VQYAGSRSGQWVERLKQFLSLGKDDLGVIGGGKRKPSGRIDVAVIKSQVLRTAISQNNQLVRSSWGPRYL